MRIKRLIIGHSPDIRCIICSDSMAAHNKRPHVAVSSEAEFSADPDQKNKKLKRRVSLATFDKWKRQFNDDYHTSRWLQCDKDNTDYTVTLLWCEVCRKYKDQIRTMRNFSSAWVNGSANQRNSNIVDHAKSEQHAAAMARMRTETGEAAGEEEKMVFVVENAALLASFSIMDETEMERIKRKFQICYMMAREGVPFQKYIPLHNLQELHGVDLGPSYKTDGHAKVFTNYIAKSQRQLFQDVFAERNFFSFILHRAISEGYAIVLVQCLVKNDVAKEIGSYCRYVKIVNLAGAYDSEMRTHLGVSLGQLGVDILSEDKTLNIAHGPILVAGSSDGANNDDDRGMKAELHSTFPWLFWSWCFSHQLELACNNALTSSLYEEINNLLIYLYSIGMNSLQKTHQLAPIVEDLKEVFQFLDTGDSVLVHNQGIRWISHKRRALQRIVDRFGVYCAHLHSMTSDPTLDAADQIKLKSFHQRWTEGRILIGCALYIDVLKAPSQLSLSLLESEIDVISGIKHILKTMQTFHLLRKKDPQEWPTFTTVLATLAEQEDSKSYQGVDLTNFNSSTVSQCSALVLADLHMLDGKLKDWLTWPDTKLLDAILSFLDTRCWATVTVNTSSTNATTGGLDNGMAKSKQDYDKRVTEIKAAVAYIVAIFRDPLEAKGADLCSINDELEEMFSFCTNYVDVLAEDYKKIWYKLFSAHDAQKWRNVLLISELLFSLPFANSKVGQALSALQLIIAERQSISSTTLDDLMEINVEGVPTECYTADPAVQQWLASCTQNSVEESSDSQNSVISVLSTQHASNDVEFSWSDRPTKSSDVQQSK